jgi:hypothetical protein
MARIRTIKPEFFTSEDIVELSPFARLLYIATWCEADREGRLNWKPKTFKIRYFPADSIDVEALCTELTQKRLVVLYGDGFAYIPSFLKHQHVNPREAKSDLLAPFEANVEANEAKSTHSRVTHASARVTDTQVGRKEGKESNDASLTQSFESFWSVYPKRKNKGQAEKAFAKINPDSDLLQTILNAVEGADGSADWLKANGQFIPYPATWLGARGWEDEAGSGGAKPWEV